MQTYISSFFCRSHIVIFSKYIHPGEDLAISVNCLQEIPKRETVHAELLLDRERTVLSKVAGQASSGLLLLFNLFNLNLVYLYFFSNGTAHSIVVKSADTQSHKYHDLTLLGSRVM